MDPLDISIDSVDLAVDHPDIISRYEVDIEPTDIALEHPAIAIEPELPEPTDIALEHPAIAIKPELPEPTDIALDHPKLAIEPHDIEIEPNDLVLQHPKLTIERSAVEVEPTYLAFEHPKVASNISGLKIEPNDIAMEHPKIATTGLNIEPTDIAIDHPKIAIKPTDIAVEPDEIASEHPKIATKPSAIKVEPTDIALEHPKIFQNPSDMKMEPVDVAAEHPDIVYNSTTSFRDQGKKEDPFDVNYEEMAAKMAEKMEKDPDMNIDSLVIWPRTEWSAAEPQKVAPLKTPVKTVLSSLTGTEPCTADDDCRRVLRELQTEQMENGLSDIQWNFMIGGTGKVYEGRGFHGAPAIPPHFNIANVESLNIGYIGNSRDEDVKCGMFASMVGLLALGQGKGHIPEDFKYLQDDSKPTPGNLPIERF